MAGLSQNEGRGGARKEEIVAHGLRARHNKGTRQTRARMNDKASYVGEWVGYAERRSLFRFVLFSIIPGAVVLGLPFNYVLRSEWPLIVLAALWAVASLAAGIYLTRWECPRCGKPFLRRGWRQNISAGGCAHCRLPKWAESDPGYLNDGSRMVGVRK